MRDKTKKWLVTAGLTIVCVGLVFGISRVLYREPEQGTTIREKDAGETEITIDIGKPENIKAEETGTGETLVTEIDIDTGTADGDQEQELQPEPEKTEEEKPAEPPVVSEESGTGKTGTPPAGEVAKDAETKPAVNEQTPKTGDTKDGMVYVEGFGWLPDEGAGSGTYAEDMYENGNKIGIMD